MLHKNSKHPSGQYRKSTHHFFWFLCLWLHFLPQVNGFFMSDTKAVLQGCDDYWTFQSQGHIPVLFLTTVCVDVRVLSLGTWTAFSYVSAPAARYELALQGDGNSLYAWLLGVRHQFPVHLIPLRWYHLCLRWDAPHKSFSLTIRGHPEVYQRTAIARAIPPSGRLLLGCQLNKASPGVNISTVELYLFRIWDDVGEHQACEDGTVVGWDSQFWTVTRAQARVQDSSLQCGLKHLRKKRVAQKNTPKSIRSSGPATSRNNFLKSPSPLFSTLGSLITNTRRVLQENTASIPPRSTSISMVTLPAQGHITNTTSQARTTLNSSKVNVVANSTANTSEPITTPTTPSVNLTRPTQAPLTKTTTSDKTITIPPQVLIGSTVNITTITSHNGYFNITDSPSSNQTIRPTHNTSARTLSSPPINGNASSANPSSESTIQTAAHLSTTPTVKAQVANQSAVLRTKRSTTLITESFGVPCNFSQYCADQSAYYLMPVEANGTNVTEDIKNWFSDLFKMTASIANDTADAFMNADVQCQDNLNIKRTNCTVLLKFSQPENACNLRKLVESSATNTLLKISLLGDVERVGKGVCMEQNILAPEGDFVHCTSSLSYDKVCQIQGLVNVTCSYGKNAFILNDLPILQNQSCNVENQQQCECHVSNNNEGYFALRLNISSPDVNFTSIQNVVSEWSSPCNESSILGSQCNPVASQFYQGMHLECFGEGARLYTCMLTVQLSQHVDVCTASAAVAFLWKDSTSIIFDGPVHKTAICRLPTDSVNISLNSTFTWTYVNMSASQINEVKNQLKCKQGQTFAVLLNESCEISKPTPPPSTTTGSKATSINITSPSITTTPSIEDTQHTSVTTLNTTVSVSNISFTSINSTNTQTNTLSLNTTDLPLIPSVTLPTTIATHRNTPGALENATLTPVNISVPLVITVTPPDTTAPTLNTKETQFNTTGRALNTTITTLNTTNTTFNANETLLPTTVTPLNTTITTLTTTITTSNSKEMALNTTVITLNATVTPTTTTITTLNTTVTRLNTTDTTLNPTDTLLNTTVTTLNTTITTLNTTVTPTTTTITTLNTTVTTLNTTDTTLNPTDTLLNTTVTTPKKRIFLALLLW
ncbi:uncharacterized protein LOC130546675 [Triplophysa rosa]|uniref:uncharacterized protein LOC130546675 n=1 Tax=Triplophysa rosa TaxID=992332 RepID=UPI002546183A|nr:uncharacterized protein LOC130546675 [Triplophysa rosa]